MSVKDCWRPKRAGPPSDRDSVTRQTLQAGIWLIVRYGMVWHGTVGSEQFAPCTWGDSVGLAVRLLCPALPGPAASLLAISDVTVVHLLAQSWKETNACQNAAKPCTKDKTEFFN